MFLNIAASLYLKKNTVSMKEHEESLKNDKYYRNYLENFVNECLDRDGYTQDEWVLFNHEVMSRG